MTEAHPSYPSPTIQEALCEIHFRLPAGVEWKPSWFGEFFKHLQPDFPEFEPAQRMGLQLQIGPHGAGQALMPPRYRMSFRHSKKNLILQLSESTLTVNVLPKYPGWTDMRQDILSAWEKARESVNPSSVERIGLRYINRIDREQAGEPAGAWLAANEYLPRSVLASKPGFLARVVVRPEENRRLIVTLGETPDDRNEMSAIILDIDCILERDTAVESHDIGSAIDQLHDAAWGAFSSSTTPRLQGLLNVSRA